MGLDDRDYMRERHRRQLNAHADERPFLPAKETSLFVIVACWIGIAFLLFQAYAWWDQKQLREKPARQGSSMPARGEMPAPAAPPRAADAPPVAAAAPRPLPPPEVHCATSGGTLYHCRNADRSTFWANTPCSAHGATIDRMTSVPADLPFGEQVRIAEERRRALTPPPMHVSEAPAAAPEPAIDHGRRCAALEDRVRELDAMAREPHSAPMQDWIRSQRKLARDTQFRLRC